MNQIDKNRQCVVCGNKTARKGLVCCSLQCRKTLNEKLRNKEKKFCIICGSEILGQGNKFCKKECYVKYRTGQKRPEFAKKIKQIMLDKLESYKGTKRAINISNAKKQEPLTEEEWDKLKQTKEIYPWITNTEVFIEKAKLNRKLRKGLKDEVHKFIRIGKKDSFFNVKIQKWDIEKIEQFKKDVLIIPWNKLLETYEITNKEFHSLRLYFGIKNYVYKHHNFYNTKPERMFEQILIDKDIKYVREKYINNNRWRVDFVINDEYFIEINGDYWHANPRSFNEKSLTTAQIVSIENDKRKKDFILNSGKKLFYIWEMDLYNNIDSISQFLEKFLKGEISENFVDSKDI
jgi:predicted nucleic acid-binding Zn ribbon protein